MKLVIIFTLIFLSSNLFSDITLKKNYYIEHNYILLSNLVPSPKKDITLYKFDISKHTKRLKSKDVEKKLQEYGYLTLQPESNYIQFTQKSPIKTLKMKQYIKQKYHEIYKDIIIKKIRVEPRKYLHSLPENYEIALQGRYYLSRSGVLYIKTQDKKKIFFNYDIEAKLDIYFAKRDIKKGEELSIKNLKKSSIILDKFRALPLQILKKSSLEAKHQILKEKIITARDVMGLYLVRRGSTINITLESQGLNISLFAKALQNGRFSQTIYALTANKKKIKVVVTGKNRAKIDE